MKRNLTLILVATAMLMLAAGPAMAGAFRIPEAGTPAMGQANAFVGQADDPSAVHHNSAGLVNLDGTQIMVGMNMITPEATFTDDLFGASADADDQDFFVPYFFYTNHLGDSDWWVGFGVSAPFGLGTEWDDSASFNGALEAYASSLLAGVPLITETTLEIVKIAPVFAHRLNDRFSYGFGPEYYSVQEIVYDGGSTTGPYKVDGDGDAWGFGLSALYQATDALNVGFAYHSGVTAEVDVDATNFPIAVAPGFYTGNASVDLNLPDTIALGVHYQVSDAFSFNLDLDQTMWSDYDKLEFKDSSGAVLRTVPKDYDDVLAVRIGGEYSVNENWTVRAGYLTEPSPVEEDTFDPRLPDADATAFFLGGGYDTGQWAINGAYMALTKDDRNVDTDEPTPGGPLDFVYDGKYEANVDIFALDFIYRF